MARRYGKVTVTGWIEQTTAETYVAVGPRGMLSPLVARIYEDNAAVNAGASVVVEFLPEPVVFKDGDTLQFGKRNGGDGSVVVRENGVWHCSHEGHRVHDDAYVGEFLVLGVAVRLVPAEGTTDA